LGLDYLLLAKASSLNTKLTVFNNNVTDWIIWLPTGSVWRPQNYKKVWARGIDLSVNININYNNWQWGVDLMGTGTISTTEKSNIKSEVGKQLPYIPKIKASGSVFLGYKTFRIKYNQTYTSKRYTVANNSSGIDPYSIATISAEKSVDLQSFTIKTFLRLDNIWNEEYQAMAWYPMPLRNYQIGVSILLNKTKH